MFALAVEQAPSDSVRADYFYSRGSSRHGTAADFERALEYFPSHGPSLYRRVGLVGGKVGRPTTPRGRLAYWCLADLYRDVVERVGQGRIADAALRVAAQYERAAPSVEQVAELGLTTGDSVTVDMGEAETCTTTVR